MQGLNELSFKALRLFVAVLDLGSFSEVARREGLAPSSISRQIQLMEQALGQQLLYRHTRAVSPTEAGRLLGRHARLMLEQLEAAGQALQEQESEPSGLVRINAPMVFGQRHLSPWLGELCRRYPKLQLDIQQTDTYVDPLQDGTDLLFRIGVLNDSSMQARIFAPQRFRIAASPAYLARHGTPQHPDELINHQCLAYKGITGQQRWFFRKGQGDRCRWPNTMGALMRTRPLGSLSCSCSAWPAASSCSSIKRACRPSKRPASVGLTARV